MGPLTTPKKGREVGSGDPWTPTSNLKMLISAASPDIRNREKELGIDTDGRECVDSAQVQKHTQKDDIHGTVCVYKETFLPCFLFWQDIENGEESERWISRKEKSLGLLCHKFLARYPDCPNSEKNNDICLDDVATELSMTSLQTQIYQKRLSFTLDL